MLRLRRRRPLGHIAVADHEEKVRAAGGDDVETVRAKQETGTRLGGVDHQEQDNLALAALKVVCCGQQDSSGNLPKRRNRTKAIEDKLQLSPVRGW